MKYSDDEDPQFQKVFEFERTHEWRLPKSAFTAPHFHIQELQDMKRDLNHVKGKLNEFNLAEWTLHTQSRDVAGYVIGQLKRRIRPELLTQAWCKFYEVLCTFPVIKLNETGCFRSLHLCEAPGAFICALNHYLALHYPCVRWQWFANTLNPNYEGNPRSQMIPDDRLICYTRDRWLFGIDLTGDIQQYYNHIDIKNQTISEQKVNLVTADGSIDCMSDPGEQERLVEFLHYCETITALSVLDTGGTFVLKIFTIFEESTVCLLYLLNCIFDKTYLFKPCTSKSGNSELYLVCIGFNAYDLSSIWDTLISPYKKGVFDNNKSMFSVDQIPNSFKVQLKSCCSDFFLERQINTINDNIYYYLHSSKSEKDYLHYRKVEIANRYIKKYWLKAISKHCRVVPYLDVHVRPKDTCELEETRSVCLKDWDLIEFVDITLGKRIDFVHTSKFASIECIENLTKHLNNNKTSSLYNLVVNALKMSTMEFNIKSFSLVPYFKYQKDLFNSVLAAIDKQKHLFFLNVLFHTNFLAALWCILASAFESVYFGPGWCLFYKPVATKVTSAKSILSAIRNAYDSIGNNAFPCDIIYVFKPKVFDNNLNFVSQILKVCNNFQLPI